LTEFLSVEEATSLLRVNPKTLYEHIKVMRPRWSMRLGRIIRINRSALLDSFRIDGLEVSQGKRGAALGENQ